MPATTSVAISTEFVVVGAINEGDSWTGSLSTKEGAAYLFRRKNDGAWVEGSFLKPSNRETNAIFGNAMDIDGDTFLVAARRESETSTYSGAAYVFQSSFEASSLGPYFDFITKNASNLNGVERIPTATPFNDGVSNLLRYSFNMNLDQPDTTTMVSGGDRGLPLISFTGANDEQFLRFEFVRRRHNGPLYIPEISSSLEPDSFFPVEAPWTIEPIDEEWERVIVLEPTNALASKVFGRVRVSMK